MRLGALERISRALEAAAATREMSDGEFFDRALISCLARSGNVEDAANSAGYALYLRNKAHRERDRERDSPQSAGPFR